MRPLDFYRLGLSLAETANDEASQRTAVGRLYYGLHHEACCRYFRSTSDTEPLNGSQRHSELRNRYNRRDNSKSKEVGNLLRDLMTLRREADYELAPPLRFRRQSLAPRQFLELAVKTAEQLLNALEDYSPGEAEDGCRCLVSFRPG